MNIPRPRARPRPRPRIHFTPRSGWINDPLAVTWHHGEYHVFFQFVPDRTSWATGCHWGHASSADLLTWTELPVILEPDGEDDGIWSGSIAIDAAGQPTLYYTSVTLPDVGIGRIRTAVPTDDTWMTWAKGPVIVDAPALDLVAFRDPFLMRDDGRWRMLVGTAIRGGDAAASSFSSDDLLTWTFDGLAARRNTAETEPVWTGALWECPQVFSIDGRDILVTSVWQDDDLHSVAYGVGNFTAGRFQATNWGRLSYGPSYYAASFFRDRDGRACLVYWMRGVLDEDAGRAGALSVPHVLTLRGDVLVSEPHPALGEPSPVVDAADTPGNAFLSWDSAEDTELRIDGSSPVTVRRREGELTIEHEGVETTVPLGADRVRVLVDGETLEIFTDRGVFALGIDQPFGRVTMPEPPLLHGARSTGSPGTFSSGQDARTARSSRRRLSPWAATDAGGSPPARPPRTRRPCPAPRG